MNQDEFAFANQQLAGMLQAGLPLEGALGQLCATMRDGALKAELTSLASDLASGTPFAQAVSARRFPPLYAAMLRAGQAGNDLPGVLLLMADHYRRAHVLWTRLQGLLVYPLIVLASALGLAVLIALGSRHIMAQLTADVGSLVGRLPAVSQELMAVQVWAPVVVLGLLVVALVALLRSPRMRERFCGILPGFREAGISQAAASLGLMLSRGCRLPEALEVVRQLEPRSRMAGELECWQARLAQGVTRFQDVAEGGRVFPPLFTWMVASSNEDWAAGFRHAGEVYHNRAVRRMETTLYATLPVSVLMLGLLIIGQLTPVYVLLTQLMTLFGSGFE